MMTWWTWMILGAVLLGAELFAIEAQFYLIFIGLSAILVGAAGLFGLTMPEWLQWIAFGILSLSLVLMFRKGLYEKLHGSSVGFDSSVAGETIAITNVVEPGREAREQHRGSDWTVRNVGGAALIVGSRAKIVKVDGLTLHVEAEQ